MNYNEICKILQKGKVGKLPSFIGYFKWNYGINDIIFQNRDFQCRASDLNVLNRKDFYYII